MAVQTYAGSCHCGDVRFEVDLDLAGGGGKCNCTMCRKTRNWSASVKPDAFRLLVDPSVLADYQHNTRQVHWRFCRRCGVRPYLEGDIPEAGGPFVAVQLACLDDIDDALLAATPVRYANGRADDWWHEPTDHEKAFL
jgi:hypothetical protein